MYRAFIVILSLLLIFNNYSFVTFAQEKEDAKGGQEVEGEEIIEEENVSSIDENEVLKGYVSKIPSGTKIKVIVETPLDEGTINVDDEFIARTSEDIIVDGEVVIPVGSSVNGVVSEVNLARRLHRSGSIRIEFKNIKKPDGIEAPIVASVLTHSGLLKGKLTPKNALISTATVAAPALAGGGAGIAAEGSGLGLVVGAALGLLGGLALFAYQRGNMVNIKAGDELKIELTEEALVPIASNIQKEPSIGMREDFTVKEESNLHEVDKQEEVESDLDLEDEGF